MRSGSGRGSRRASVDGDVTRRAAQHLLDRIAVEEALAQVAPGGLIYPPGLPPVCLNWLLFILERVPGMQARRNRLLQQAADLRLEIGRAGLASRGESQIVPVLLGDNSKTEAVAARLREAGYWVTAVRPPTVPENTARIRLSVSSSLETADLAPLPGLIRSATR